MPHYTIFVKVPNGEGAHGSDWEPVVDAKMNFGAANARFNELVAQHPQVRMFCGQDVGRLVRESAGGVA